MDFESIGNDNRYIRGFIMRSIAIGKGNQASPRQIIDALIGTGRIIVPDISKHVDYLVKKGYIAFTNRKITIYSKYAQDGMLELLPDGQDIVDSTTEDPGVEI